MYWTFLLTANWVIQVIIACYQQNDSLRQGSGTWKCVCSVWQLLWELYQRSRCFSLQRPTSELQRCQISYINHIVFLTIWPTWFNTYGAQSMRRTRMKSNICNVLNILWMDLLITNSAKQSCALCLLTHLLQVNNAVKIFLKAHLKHQPLATEQTRAGPAFIHSPKENQTNVCDSVCAAILCSSFTIKTKKWKYYSWWLVLCYTVLVCRYTQESNIV